MQVRFLFWWDRLRTSLWFVPGLLVAASLMLSLAMVTLDHRVGSDRGAGAWWLYGGAAEGARGVLSAIGGSMITVAGVVFSVMMVVLSLAAQQYGPRLLRNFMRDRVTQLVLGVFVATFVYSLMVLRTIRGEDGHEFVPQFAVSVGVALALVSIGLLIYFIHHVSVSIHVNEIISRVQAELMSAIDVLFPEALGVDEGEIDDSDRDLSCLLDESAAKVEAKHSGYLEAIDVERLLQIAKKCDLIVRLEVQPGAFLLPGQVLLLASSQGRMDDERQDSLRSSFLIGGQRTPVQDILYAINQQVDVAIRALSPGINDPFTAINCLDRLCEALCRLAERRFPSALRYDDDGELRVVAPSVTFAGIIETALGPIREYSRASTIVTVHLLEVVGRVSERVRRGKDRQALFSQLDAIRAEEYVALSSYDRARLRETEVRVRRTLSAFIGS